MEYKFAVCKKGSTESIFTTEPIVKMSKVQNVAKELQWAFPPEKYTIHVEGSMYIMESEAFGIDPEMEIRAVTSKIFSRVKD